MLKIPRVVISDRVNTAASTPSIVGLSLRTSGGIVLKNCLPWTRLLIRQSPATSDPLARARKPRLCYAFAQDKGRCLALIKQGRVRTPWRQSEGPGLSQPASQPAAFLLTTGFSLPPFSSPVFFSFFVDLSPFLRFLCSSDFELA